MLDLSQSMNPFAPDARAVAARHLDALGHYPSPADGTALLADAMGVAAERLVLTNGGSEAISLVRSAIGGRVDAEPEFALHPRGDDGPVWRSDPHNPTGQLAPPDAVADVWDEAFYPLASGQWTAGRPGITVGSLTKVFNCPGLRLGYILADDASALAVGQPHWSVNSLALAVLPDLLAATELPAWHERIVAARAELAELFRSAGMVVRVGDAPWVLVEDAALRLRLAPHGVVVRDCASFGMDGVMRVSVTDDRGLERLATALGATA